MNTARPFTALVAGVMTIAAAAGAQGPVAAPAGLSTTGQPTSYAVTGQTYRVSGYRSAQWGMTPAQVRQAIARDFPGLSPQPIVDPVTKVHALLLRVADLPPGSVPALVTYIFGATSGRLMHVNVVWNRDAPSPQDRAAMIEAGSRAVATFLGYYWKLLSVARGIPTTPNGLVLFAGGGEEGGAVEVRIEGIAYVAKTRLGDVPSPAPTGPVTLRVSFAQTPGQPDVYRLKPGDF